MLGTVQWGLPYGIANTAGQPTLREVCAMLEAAASYGINGLDTAVIYGESERVLGEALRQTGLCDHFFVVSKVPTPPQEFAADDKAAAWIETTVRGSLQRLQLQQLPLCLFHQASGFRYVRALEDAREKGLIGELGVSCLQASDAPPLLADARCRALQIPFSALDRGWKTSGALEQAARQNVTVFARSIYLQGLLVMPESQIPPALADIVPARRIVAARAAQWNMSLEELAFAYVAGHPAVTALVVGIETLAQLQSNAALWKSARLTPAQIAQLDDELPVLPERLTLPNQWKVADPWANRSKSAAQ